MKDNFLIYGSYGYTGDLIARQAAARGLKPILGGRDPEKLKIQAGKLGLEYRVFSLQDSAAVLAAVEEVGAVLHCAGPFSLTSKPMAEGCIQARTHYLDITGEIAVFQMLSAQDARAKSAGVILLPGVGFDVVPSDCLAAHLKSRLPSAVKLALAFRSIAQPSRGTALTALEGLHQGGLIRRGGELKPVPAAWKTRQVDFGRGPVKVVSLPWGDVFTAYYSTGIPNIEVYMAVPSSLRRLMVLSRYTGWLLASTPIQELLARLVKSQPVGPTEAQRKKGLSLLWGEVLDNAGNRRAARMQTPEGYQLSMLTALGAVQKVLSGQTPAGFQTPSLAFGADFILQFEGVSLQDLA
jgi:short subunit dehydrogenase-like uncharacterized protein